MDIDKYIDVLYYEEFEKYDDDYDWYDCKEKDYKKHKAPRYRYEKCPVCPKPYPQGCQYGQGYQYAQQCPTCQYPGGMGYHRKCRLDKNRTASETWIPYATGPAADLVFATGATTASQAIGFGSSGTVLVSGPLGSITLTDPNFAFAVPREACLRTLAAYLTVTTAPVEGLGTVTIFAQLYRAEPGSNLFTPIPGATVAFPAITSTTAVGTTFNGIVKGINYPLCEQDRLLLVYTATSTGAAAEGDTIGFTASAGVAIS